MTQSDALPGLDIPISRVAQIRHLIADHGHNVSYRKSGQPFLPEGRGYNRSDGVQEVPEEFNRLTPYVMRHRTNGGRIEVLHSGRVMCDRCAGVFATLAAGMADPALIQPCAEETDRDREHVRVNRAKSRAQDNMEELMAFFDAQH